MDPQEKRLAEAKALVKKYVMAAVGAGIVPVPLLDGALISGLQLALVQGLAQLYQVEFRPQLAKSCVAALAGGALSSTSTGLLKLIPVIGPITGILSVPVVGGASTKVIGELFIQHFESGGTFLTFDPAQVRQHYESQLEHSKEELKQTFTGILP